MRKFGTALIVVVFIILFLSNYNQSHDSTIRISHINWPGFEPLALAESEDLFENINVEHFRLSNNEDVVRAFEQGIVDVIAITLNEAVELQSRISDRIQILTILDISNGGDVIIAKKDIKNLNELENRRIAVEPTAFGNYFVSRALESASNISTKNLFVYPATAEKHFDLFLTDKVDAVATYEPSKSQILYNKGHVIFDSSEIPNEIFDVLVTKESYAQNNTEALQKLVDGFYSALDYIDREPDKSITILAEFENTDKETYQKSLQGIHIPTREETAKLMSGDNPALFRITKQLHNFLVEKHFVKSATNILPVISDAYVRNE